MWYGKLVLSTGQTEKVAIKQTKAALTKEVVDEVMKEVRTRVPATH